MAKKDYYTILGVAKNASADDIKQAYRRLAMKYHPDRNSDPGAADTFTQVKEAYEVLSDVKKRAAIDNAESLFRHNSDTAGSWADVDSGDFKDIFGDFMAARHFKFSEDIFKEYGHRQRTADSVCVATISLASAYTGGVIEPAPGVKIVIPAGMRSGTKFYLNGTIYKVEVALDNKFKRSLDDLMTEVSLDAIEAILGVEALLTHLDNTTLKFSIPAGIQHGQIIKLSGKGMNAPDTNKIGDLLIRVNITIPRGLSAELHNILRAIPHRTLIDI